MILSTFSHTCWHFVYLLWRNVYLGPLPVFKIGLKKILKNIFKKLDYFGAFLLLLLSCRSSLYMLNIYSLSGICSTNIFSCSIGYIFILFISLAYVVAPFGSLGERDSGRWLSGTVDKSSGHFQIRSILRSAFNWPTFRKLLSLLLDTRVLHPPTWIPKLLQRHFG